MNGPKIFLVETRTKLAFSSGRVHDEEEEDEDEETVEKKDETGSLKGPDAPLYDAINPMVYALRVFGFAPYAYSKDKMLVPSNINMIFSIVASIFYTYTIYNVMSTFMMKNVDNSPILDTTEKGKVFLNYFVLMMSLLHCSRSRQDFSQIWNDIADFDVNLQKRGYVRSELRTKVWMWVMIAGNILVWFSVNQAGMSAFWEPWYKNVSYLLLYVASSVVIFKFIGVTYCLGQRFSYLNWIIGKNESSSYDEDFKTEIDTKWAEIMYSDLLTISERFISLNSTLLFLWLLNLAGHSVSNCYFLLEWCSSDDVHIPYYIVWCLLSWLFAYMAQLILLHISCHFTATEANCTSYVLLNSRHMLLQRNNNENVNLQSTLHMLHRRLKFLAAGCFNVNLSLLRSMTGVLTTYIVILLQLPDEKDGIDHDKTYH